MDYRRTIVSYLMHESDSIRTKEAYNRITMDLTCIVHSLNYLLMTSSNLSKTFDRVSSWKQTRSKQFSSQLSSHTDFSRPYNRHTPDQAIRSPVVMAQYALVAVSRATLSSFTSSAIRCHAVRLLAPYHILVI